MHTATDIPEEEPKEFTAGETVKWTRDLSDHYPADESWLLNYTLIGPSKLTFSGTPADDEFAITLSLAQTAALKPGRYTLTGRVSKAGEVFPVYSSILDVLEDPTQIEEGRDMRSDAKQILAAHIETYKTRAARREKAYSVSAVGRSFTYDELDALLKAIDYWTAVVRREEDPTGKQNQVLVRFTRPR
jgi:hypothetical protein